MAPRHRHPIVASIAISRDVAMDHSKDVFSNINLIGVTSILPVHLDEPMQPGASIRALGEPEKLTLTVALLYPAIEREYRIEFWHRSDMQPLTHQTDQIVHSPGGGGGEVMRYNMQFTTLAPGLNVFEVQCDGRKLGEAAFMVQVMQGLPDVPPVA